MLDQLSDFWICNNEERTNSKLESNNTLELFNCNDANSSLYPQIPNRND